MRPPPETRNAYSYHLSMTTRWRDNDVYAHMNNVVYYEYFDSVVNRWLIETGFLDMRKGDVIGLVVETQCHYFSPMAFPDHIVACMRVGRIGRSSITYEVALFRNEDFVAAAQGRFVHVYVDQATRRPVPLPEQLRGAAESLVQVLP